MSVGDLENVLGGFAAALPRAADLLEVSPFVLASIFQSLEARCGFFLLGFVHLLAASNRSSDCNPDFQPPRFGRGGFFV